VARANDLTASESLAPKYLSNIKNATDVLCGPPMLTTRTLFLRQAAQEFYRIGFDGIDICEANAGTGRNPPFGRM